MERWSGRVAVVTGASSGIGAAIARELVNQGLRVVGLARRVERIQSVITKGHTMGFQELADSLKESPGRLFAVKTDVTKEEDILSAFKWVKENLGGVDVMVNNAGVGFTQKLSEGKTADWKQTLDVNVLGLCICTREAIKSMKERGVDDGHTIHINSIAGHSVMNFDGIAMYTGTKHAVTVLTEGLRKELTQLKSKIRITSISPGAVDTEMGSGADIPKEMLEMFKAMPKLESKDVADAVIYTLSTPPHVQVNEIIIHPTGEM